MSTFVHLRGEGVKNGLNLVHVVIERPHMYKVFCKYEISRFIQMHFDISAGFRFTKNTLKCVLS